MTLELAVRLTEILVALAFIQQSLEHLLGPTNEKLIFIPRLFLSCLLLAGIQTPFVCLGLFVTVIAMLHRFQGPYNGGSDRMGHLLVICLCLIHFLPFGQELVFGYLALQLVLSYFVAGWVKIMNSEWRMGRALQDVFLFSTYPVSESLRGWAGKPQLLFVMSWAVMLFEVLFPFTLLSQPSLIAGLTIAAVFHFANACLFGLNRFFWIWLAAYPSIMWLQQRIFETTLSSP